MKTQLQGVFSNGHLGQLFISHRKFYRFHLILHGIPRKAPPRQFSPSPSPQPLAAVELFNAIVRGRTLNRIPRNHGKARRRNLYAGRFFFFLLPVLCPIPTSQGITVCQHLIPTVPKPVCSLISLIISLCNLNFYKEDVLLGHQKRGSKDACKKKANQAQVPSLLLVCKRCIEQCG